MWPLVAIIAGIIGLLHYLSSSKSQTQKRHWQDNRQNKAGWAVPKAMMSNSDGIIVLDDPFYKSPCYELQRSLCNSDALNLCETRTDRPEKRKVYSSDDMELELDRSKAFTYMGGEIKSVEELNQPIPGYIAYFSNNPPSFAFDALERRRPIVGNVMEALADSNTHLIGVYGSDDDIKDTLLRRVERRIQRDNLFHPILTATVTRKSDVKMIQKEIADRLGLNFNHKSKEKRAQELIGRIKTEQKILIVLRDLHKGFDLSKIGIPYGSNHTGCKILLTSTTEDVLSKQMHTQKNFMV